MDKQQLKHHASKANEFLHLQVAIADSFTYADAQYCLEQYCKKNSLDTGNFIVESSDDNDDVFDCEYWVEGVGL